MVGGSVIVGFNKPPDIQDYIEHMIQTHEKLTTIPSIHVYINWISNRLVLKIKDGYKLELQMSEKTKLFEWSYFIAYKTNRQNKKRRKHTKSWNSWSSFKPMQFSR